MNSKPFSVTWWAIALTTISGVLAGIGPIVETLPAEWRGVARSVIAGVGLVVALVLRSAFFDRNGDGTPDALERTVPPANGPGASA
jgi:hypothetical protein